MADVYIAIGHGRRPDGSFDPGATDGSHSEQEDAVPVATACTQVLRDHGVEVISEHEDEDDPNYPETTSRANQAGVDALVSFHYDWNQAPPGAFAIATSNDGRELGWAIEDRVAEAGFDIRDYPDDRDGLYLLDNSHAPAVIFECGRIGHEDIDETDEQRAMGEAAARGILDWLGIKEDLMPAPITPQSDKEAIRVVQEGTGVTATGKWDSATRNAVIALAERSGTGDPKGLDGDLVNGRMFFQLLEETSRKTALSVRWTKKQIISMVAGSGVAGAGTAEVIEEIVRRLAG